MRSSAALASLAVFASGLGAEAQGPQPDWNSSLSGGGVTAVAVDPASPALMLAGSFRPNPAFGEPVLFHSSDGGASWSTAALPVGIDSATIVDLEILASGAAFAATEYNGLWKSTDSGATWSAYSGFSAPGNFWGAELCPDPNLPDRIWAGFGANAFFVDQNIWLSDDSGVTWSNRSPAGTLSWKDAGAIAVDPSDSNQVVALLEQDTVVVSMDAGLTWSIASVASDLQDVAHDGSRILVAGSSEAPAGQPSPGLGSGLFASSDGGATWTELSDPSWPTRALTDIKVDPATPLHLTVGSPAGLFRSLDGGVTWSFTSGSVDGHVVADVAEAAPGVSLAAALPFGVYKSTAGGPYLPFSSGIGRLAVRQLAANSSDPEQLAIVYHALALPFSESGVLTSLDGGQTWDIEPVPLSVPPADLAFDSSGRLLVLASSVAELGAKGILRRETNGTWTEFGPGASLGPPGVSNWLQHLALGSSGLMVVGGTYPLFFPSEEVMVQISTDGGATWAGHLLNVSNNDIVGLVVVPDGTDQKIVVATRAKYTGFGPVGKILFSHDAGATPFAPAVGFAGYDAPTSLASTATGDRLFATVSELKLPPTCTGPTLFESTDGGATWAPLGATGCFGAVLVDPLRDERLYLAARDMGFGSGGPRVSLSMDAGATASPFEAGLQDAYFAPNDLLGVERADGTVDLFLSTETGLFVERGVGPWLESDTASLPIAGGGVAFDLAAGVAHAGETRWLFGSLSGTTPGLSLGSLLLPLNPDAYFNLTLSAPTSAPFTGFFGTLDSKGRSSASVTAPALPGLAGLVVSHAFVTLDPTTLAVTAASNPASFTLVP